MSTEQFWTLIERARDEVGSDPDNIAGRAVDLLATRPAEEIVTVQRAIRRLMADSYRRELWGAAYLINGGASDDGFEYFRGWLLTQGRHTFEQVVAMPDRLADVPDVLTAAVEDLVLECEESLGIAVEAYQLATGENLPAFLDVPAYPPLDGPGWDFDDAEETERRLPRLSAMF